MPGPNTFTPGKDANFTYKGTSYALKAGKLIEIPYTDPCDVKQFIIAANTATGLSLAQKSSASWKQLLAQCQSGSGSGTGTSPKNVPAPKVDPPPVVPAETGSDGGVPSGTGETPESLGSPVQSDSGDSVETPKPAPGESDGRTPAEQYFDPVNPIPDYDLPPILDSQGVDPKDMETALQNVMRNAPPPGLPHPDFSPIKREKPDTLLDPVIPFTGQIYAGRHGYRDSVPRLSAPPGEDIRERTGVLRPLGI
jgi:hypothetical protein